MQWWNCLVLNHQMQLTWRTVEMAVNYILRTDSWRVVLLIQHSNKRRHRLSMREAHGYRLPLILAPHPGASSSNIHKYEARACSERWCWSTYNPPTSHLNHCIWLCKQKNLRTMPFGPIQSLMITVNIWRSLMQRSGAHWVTDTLTQRDDVCRGMMHL